MTIILCAYLGSAHASEDRVIERRFQFVGVIAHDKASVAVIRDLRKKRTLYLRLAQKLPGHQNFNLARIDRQGVVVGSINGPSFRLRRARINWDSHQPTSSGNAYLANPQYREQSNDSDWHTPSGEVKNPNAIEALQARYSDPQADSEITYQRQRKDLIKHCAGDARKFCDPKEPDENLTMICLLEHQDEVSATCNNVLTLSHYFEF